MSNPNQIFKIDAMVAFLWHIKHVYLFLTHPVRNRFTDVKVVVGPNLST